MSTKGHNPNGIDYNIEIIGYKSDIAKVSFEYNGSENGYSEDVAYEFTQDISTPFEIFGHKISLLSFRPGLKQEGNSVYVPHKTADEAEEIVENYLKQLEQ